MNKCLLLGVVYFLLIYGLPQTGFAHIHSILPVSRAGSEARAIDKTAPLVTLSTLAQTTVNGPFQIRITFSETVTNFSLADLTLENATAAAFTSVSNSAYTSRIIPSNEGDVFIQVKANTANDIAGNGNVASNKLLIKYDVTPPAGYSIAFNQDQINGTTIPEGVLQVSNAEIAASYFYTLTSEGGGQPISGSGTAKQPNFNLPVQNLAEVADGKLTVTFYQQDAAGNKGNEVKDQSLKLTKDVVAIKQPDALKVPFNTGFQQLLLPEKVEVTYTTGRKEEVNVKWYAGSYTPQKSGRYELTGDLVLPPGTTNSNQIQVKVWVEVLPNQAPTTLTLSNTVFSPIVSATEVIGMFKTVDPDDAQFTYILAAGEGDTHNYLFTIQNDGLLLKSNSGLSGQTQFQIRVRTTDAANNSLEQAFVLKKSAYNVPEDQVKIVNTFSPNGDGVNDEWVIPELKYYNNVLVEVFDRTGVLLFTSTNPEKGWNGKDQRGRAFQGAFLYMVQIKDINLIKKGVLTVLGK